jgi:hypothetical protein
MNDVSSAFDFVRTVFNGQQQQPSAYAMDGAHSDMPANEAPMINPSGGKCPRAHHRHCTAVGINDYAQMLSSAISTATSGEHCFKPPICGMEDMTQSLKVGARALVRASTRACTATEHAHAEHSQSARHRTNVHHHRHTRGVRVFDGVDTHVRHHGLLLQQAST